VLTPSGSAPKGGPRHPHAIEITGTRALISPTPTEMRISIWENFRNYGGSVFCFAENQK
jgi:hypothetical protein